MADFLGVVAEPLRGVLELDKLEGDALFLYDAGGQADGELLFAALEGAYLAFTTRWPTTAPSSATWWRAARADRRRRGVAGHHRPAAPGALARGATSVEDAGPRGTRGVGTRTHCVHDKRAFDQEVLDWKPFDYLTYSERGPIGELLWTFALEELR